MATKRYFSVSCSSVLLLFISATLWTNLSAGNTSTHECPSTCECLIDSLRCEQGHIGFPNISSRPDIINFEFSDCLLDFQLTSVPYPQAESLIIHNCALVSIEKNAFRQTPLLDALAVTGHRHLTTINVMAFVDLENLIDLDLRGNALQHLPDGVFNDLPMLQRLDLSGNNIQFTDDLFAAGFPLIDLACNECHLTAVPTATLSKLHELEHLQLSRNSFPSLAENQLATLSQLTSLSLDSSHVGAISAGAFAGLHELAALRLGHNRLMSLPGGVFDGLVHLRELELHQNLMTSLSTSLMPKLSWKQLSVLRLAHNAWICDCELVWVLELTNVADKSSIICSQPEDVDGRHLFNMTAGEVCSAMNSSTFSSRPAMAVYIILAVVLCLALSTVLGCRIRRRRALRQKPSSALKYNVLHETV